MRSKVFQNPFQSTSGFENFVAGSVGCLKITENKALDADLTKCKGHTQLRRKSQVRCEMDLNPNADVIIQKTRGSRSKARRDTRAAHQTQVEVALRIASNASL